MLLRNVDKCVFDPLHTAYCYDNVHPVIINHRRESFRIAKNNN